ENQVSGQGCLNSYLCRLLISDFTNKNDVRGLSEHGSDDPGEVESDMVLNFDLIDARQVVLDRVFGRDDFAVRPVQFIKSRVQGRGLARSGRTGHAENTVW